MYASRKNTIGAIELENKACQWQFFFLDPTYLARTFKDRLTFASHSIGVCLVYCPRFSLQFLIRFKTIGFNMDNNIWKKKQAIERDYVFSRPNKITMHISDMLFFIFLKINNKRKTYWNATHSIHVICLSCGVISNIYSAHFTCWKTSSLTFVWKRIKHKKDRNKTSCQLVIYSYHSIF